MINWQMLVLKLRKHKSIRQIAIELEMDGQGLQKLSRGVMKEPKFSAGVKLLDYYYDVYGNMEGVVL